MAGNRFEYYKTIKGNFNFKFKHSNTETLAVGGGAGYSTLASCKAGIESVKKNCNAKIEDQTLKNFEVLTNPKFEIYLDKSKKFRYRLKARNGELICISEDGYSSKDGCKKGIASLGKWAPDAEVISSDNNN